ncbi:MAG: ATP-binding protein, partial [Planctomycetes bacterium]|nr:ATP-binding protein [Planctomycetota bacterium]
MANLRGVFETCKPRPEILSGVLKEQEFAASLTKVLRGTADPVYQDPASFFANTYPTSGLKTLLSEALGRLTGKQPTNSPIVRLETSFGGGKTHSLIGLYHVCKTPTLGAALKPFVDASLVPAKPIERVAGIVGPDLETAEGLDHGDCRTFTLWGEIAYQLGGKKGYEAARKTDEARTAPGTTVWQAVIGDEPCLIMLDEIAYYLRVARGTAFQVGGTSLAEQTVAALMSLLKFAAEQSRTVVVLTLADSGDAFGKESDELREELKEAQSLAARQEHIITPAADDEISAIVTHRLFEKIDRKAGAEVADAYAEYYREQTDKQVDLPPRALRSQFRDEIVTDYPFHPDFLTTLNRKTSTIHNFQKTRGALRLLASTVRTLWASKPANTWLIHVHDMDISQDDIANDLTSRLDRPQFKQVIEADIVSPKKGSIAHAQEIDSDWVEAGKPPYARRIATTVFLHSLVQTGQSGVDPADLRLAVLQPGDEPALVEKASQRLTDICWFFDWDGFRYRFKTEPSLRKIVDDEMQMVGRVKAKGELDERIKKVWKKGTFIPVPFPHEAAEVDDDAGNPKLVIAHYDAANCTAGDATPPDLIVKLFEHAGSMEGYRTYKNNLMFLAADSDQVDRMVEVAQRYLAVRRITGDTDRMADFNEEQAKKLRQMADAAELDVRVAITKAYRYLFYPSADAPKKFNNLARELLPPQEQGDVVK